MLPYFVNEQIIEVDKFDRRLAKLQGLNFTEGPMETILDGVSVLWCSFCFSLLPILAFTIIDMNA